MLAHSLLLHLRQFLPLFRSENGLDFWKAGLTNLIDLRLLLLHGEGLVVPHRVDLLHFIVDDGTQFCFLIVGESERIFDSSLSGRRALLGGSARSRALRCTR